MRRSSAPWSHVLLALVANIAVTGFAGTVSALDLPTLDRIGVAMSIDQVRAIAGPPAEMRAIAPDLTGVLWVMEDAPGMRAAGGIFERGRGALVALAYIFAGSLGDQVQDRVRELGFTAVTGADGVVRLYGRDDDTRRPLVTVVEDLGDTTTLFAYDQAEYERRTAAGAMPAPNALVSSPAIDTWQQEPAAGAGKIDPAMRAALMAGIAAIAGQAKPIEKKTTLSSSSSTTRNSDGSVTTRSSKTTASVGVNPAGVANALMQLLK